MSKIMLVEDDNNLREIYEARLLAEGYEIISAKDGEEALALATKEKPDLIISDVMMPKISGFDMLDILRSTPGIEQTKVVMMTALSQAEDKARADKLGADKYLVKSQVTLEDVAKVADELLNGLHKSETEDIPQTELTEGTPVPAPASVPAPDPAPTVGPTTDPQTPQEPASQPTQQSPPPPPIATMPNVTSNDPPVIAGPAPQPSSTQSPPTDTSKANDTVNLIPNEPAQSTEDEKDAVNAQIDDFVQNQLKSEEPAPAEAPAQQPTATPQKPSENQLDATDGNSTASLPSAEPVQSIEVKNAPPEPKSPNQPQASSATENLVDTAATNVIDNKVAENDNNQPQPAPPKTPDPNSTTPSSATGGQRVIQPLPRTEDASKPNIHQLAQEEDETHPSIGPLPATSIVSPNGQTVTPSSPNNQPDTTQPGNVIQPGGNSDNHDINQIAL
ncbi:hypothetical protein BH23PAT2_BH23PAT2_04970 [soil metagenome]